MGDVVNFPLQPIKKQELIDELVFGEMDIHIGLIRANEIRRTLGLPVRQLVVIELSDQSSQDGPA